MRPNMRRVLHACRIESMHLGVTSRAIARNFSARDLSMSIIDQFRHMALKLNAAISMSSRDCPVQTSAAGRSPLTSDRSCPAIHSLPLKNFSNVRKEGYEKEKQRHFYAAMASFAGISDNTTASLVMSAGGIYPKD